MRLPKFYRDRGPTNDMVVQLAILVSLSVAAAVGFLTDLGGAVKLIVLLAGLPVGLVLGLIPVAVLCTYFAAEDRE